MENAIEEVKAVEDVIIGTNDGDGIVLYLEKLLMEKYIWRKK